MSRDVLRETGCLVSDLQQGEGVEPVEGRRGDGMAIPLRHRQTSPAAPDGDVLFMSVESRMLVRRMTCRSSATGVLMRRRGCRAMAASRMEVRLLSAGRPIGQMSQIAREALVVVK